jgi:hypothetical protein
VDFAKGLSFRRFPQLFVAPEAGSIFAESAEEIHFLFGGLGVWLEAFCILSHGRSMMVPSKADEPGE